MRIYAARVFMDERAYIANDSFITREIAGEVVAVPVGEASTNLNGMITFTETGGYLWKLLKERQTVDSLCKALQKEYGEDRNYRQDVEEFILASINQHLVKEISL